VGGGRRRAIAETEAERRIAIVRRFNRFYTKQIGLLGEGYLETPFSLTEARVLYELAHRERPSATELARELALDAGYLSRILRGFERRRLLTRTRSKSDGRQSHLALTARGRAAFAPLDVRSRQDIGAMLTRLAPGEQKRLIDAMRTVEAVLGARPEGKAAFVLRPHQPGDMGWVVHRHGALYAQEYGFDERFEALVAGVVAKFVERYDPRRERCWIAEKDGDVVGSVFLVRRSRSVAQLRLLLVEPKARGLGIGERLVAECVRFARQAGYRKVTLWTNSVLRAARRLYQAAGFRRVHREPHQSFGKSLVGETWELSL
jgi:DNA-binding MarR family transcriptional regulator/N-acetylglutamate synthase-like GNAT family acetyltransferase